MSAATLSANAQAAPRAKADEAPLSVRLQAGWAVGSAGSTTILYIVNALFLYFMVAHLGIAPAVAGSLMLLARAYDGIADLLIGNASDRTRSRWGRRRPWMALGAVLGGVGLGALFLPPLFASEKATSAQILVELAVLFTGYSAFAIPASAMASEMTTSYEGRTTLMAWRTFFIQAAGLVGASAAPALVALGHGSSHAYLTMGLVMAAFVTATMGATAALTYGARETMPEAQVATPARPTMKDRLAALSSIAGNRPFLALLGVKLCGYLATASQGAAGLFFMRDVAGRGEGGMARFALLSAVTGMVCVPLWRRIARGGAKERICIVALALTGLNGLSWYVCSPAEPAILFDLRGIMAGFATTGGLMMTLAMLPDAIEHDYHRTGLRREGVYAALFEFFQKAAFAIAPFLVGILMSLAGYRASVGGAVVQSAAAVGAVRLSMSVLPACTYVASISILLFFYRLPARPQAPATDAPAKGAAAKGAAA
ncbi:MAG TPA: MFS transporter [Novosphingobium sp.]|nr:MFS transporter [Novosphingobium sp.]